jgi:Predicted rRNA methylase
MAGDVLVNDQAVTKAGALIDDSAQISLKAAPRYVSRGGLKLEKALSEFSIELAGKTVLDVGASTGGFTDCLLAHGAAKVCAIDVGYGQFDWRLRNTRASGCSRKPIFVFSRPSPCLRCRISQRSTFRSYR